MTLGQDAFVRRMLVTLLAVAVLSACGGDEAELVEPGAATVHADIGQLRVISYFDDPADDRWRDVVAPPADVFEEGASFREDDSRTATADEPAELRRLFTATGPGRALLVVVDCDPCDAADQGAELLVWELVAGGGGPTFASAEGLARPDATTTSRAGELFAIVRAADADPQEPRLEGDDVAVHLARHTPEDGVDLRVDVFATTAPGTATIRYGAGASPVDYPVVVS